MKRPGWNATAPTLTALLCLLLPALALAEAGEPDRAEPKIEKKVERRVVIHGLDDSCEQLEGREGVVTRRVQRPFLGVELTALTDQLRDHFGVPGGLGAMVGSVVDDSAASRAGLRAGDIITRAGDRDIDSPGDLTRVIRAMEGGEVLDLEVWRGGKMDRITVTIDQRERCSIDFSGMADISRIVIPDIDLPDIDLEALELRALELQDLGLEHLEIGGEALERVIEKLGSVDWEQHFSQLEGEGLHSLEQRMEELQERMRELEQRLQKEQARYHQEHGRARRDLERALEQRTRALVAERQALEERVHAQARERMEQAKALAERAEVEQRRALEEQAEEVERLRRLAEEEAERAGGGSIHI